MRILYVVHQFLPKNVAGTEVYTHRLIRQMQRDHDVHLLFAEIDPQRPQYARDEGSFDGIPFTRMAFHYRLDRFEETYRNAASEQVFLGVLDRFRPDLVHLQHLQAFGVGLPVLARARAVPVVYTLHEYAALCAAGGQMILPDLVRCDGPGPHPCGECIERQPLPLEPAADPPAAARRRAEAFLDMARSVSLFLSPSRFLRDVFVANGFPADRFLATDNGFDVTPFSGFTHRPSEALRFGYVGAMVPYKGVHLLVDAFEGMEEEGWELHVHGGVRPDSPLAPYQEEIRRRARDPRIRVHGAFHPDRVAQVYEHLDVLVVPSLWVENSPLTIHEAFVCGIPVITSDLGGMAELVEHGTSGLLFAPGDVGALRDAARSLIRDRDLVERLRRGIPRVKTMPEHAREMNGIYASVRPIPLAGSEAGAARAYAESVAERAARMRAGGREPPAAAGAARESPGEGTLARLRRWWLRLSGSGSGEPVAKAREPGEQRGASERHPER